MTSTEFLEAGQKNGQLTDLVTLVLDHGKELHHFLVSNLGIRDISKNFIVSEEFSQLETKDKLKYLNTIESVTIFLEEFDRLCHENGVGAYDYHHQK